MKNIKNILLTLVFATITFAANAQCSNDKVRDACGNKLRSGFTYLKTYDVDGDGTFSYVFSKGNTYLIQNCDNSGLDAGMKITIMDRTKKVINTNFDTKTGKVNQNLLGYLCKITSIYYVKFEVADDADAECGVGILGFK